LLHAHDRHEVEVVCYASNLLRDDMTEHLRNRADAWVDISRMTDDEAARRIQRDGIDILVDLAGHTSDNRLRVLARRPAPIQMTYLGYPNTTGLSTIQYRITDNWADPEGLTDPWYTEKLLRLPRPFLAFTPPEDAPLVEPAPASRGEPFTFGSFNAIHKLSDTTLDLWAAVLKRAPGSRLLLKTADFSDEGVMERYRSLFGARGIGPERLLLLGFEPERKSHLATYHRLDVALDTFPYHGTTTTCEALYMGVPVVTLVGNVHASRVGLSLLHAVGLEHLAAGSHDAFVDAAAHLAGHPEELATLRQTLRARMSASPLMDSTGLARAIEATYRQAWREACRR
jgi:predicted O-linked N-acetylglucosamine transferase (SPINDLY family)